MNHSKRNQLLLMLMMVVTLLTVAACGAGTQRDNTSQSPGRGSDTVAGTPANSVPTLETTVVANPTTAPTTTSEIGQGSPQATSESASGETMGEHQMAMGEFDQMFIDMMVPHHQSAIEMAKIIQEQGENPELKQMAESMIQSQQTEIDQLRQWRQQWYGSNETPPMTQMPMLPGMSQMEQTGDAMTMDMTKDIERVRNAPRPVDSTFVEAMTQHHQMAIEAATMAQQQATRQEIKDMAKNIIQAQQQEIADMSRIGKQLQEQSAESLVTPTP